MKTNRQNTTLSANQNRPNSWPKMRRLNGASQPPRNRIVTTPDIMIMFMYSPRKNRAKDMDEYSVMKPATSSDSASGRSNGWRLVSASTDVKKMMNIGKCGMKYQRCVWASTTRLRFSEPAVSSTEIMMKPMETSYDTICAAERMAPRKA